jgi:ATP-dependent Lon protease
MSEMLQETKISESVDVERTMLPLLPLKNVVILPKSIVPIIVGRSLSIKAVESALKKDHTIFITSQKDQEVESPAQEDLFEYGTRATILKVSHMPNGALKILAEGICRSKIDVFSEQDGFISVSYTDLPTSSLDKEVELQAIWRQLEELYRTYSQLNDKAPADLVESVKTPLDIDYITDTIAVHIANLTLLDRQKLLETADLSERMIALCRMLQKEIEILQTEQRIRGRIQTQVEKSQREYYLTEQMKAIQKELGREDQVAEIDQIRSKTKKLKLPKDAQEKVEKELKRLEQMPSLSSEAVVSRNYVDWITSLPWSKVTKDTISLTQAERILHKNHFGLQKAKERIVEFLAAKKFSKKLDRSPILCLAGPPGVGKTSLAQSIAQSVGREFVRISLGGIRDEAEIRGHRRTYIGALPGKIIQAMKKAGVTNPVILLDEIDKMSQDLHGDPSSALLEVLDPEQNKSFVDHFLDTEYDLSKVMFIATANVMENIPYPLYDRLEVIGLSGYTDEEKREIAKQFLLPKNLNELELTKRQFQLPDDIIDMLISEYTKESGVRQLERLVTKLMRKAIQRFLKEKATKQIKITPENMKEWLGNIAFKKTSLSQTVERIGLTTGLAWTEVGGDVLEIETTVLSGKGSVTLTGQLGDVMQESAQAGMSYIRSRAQKLGLKNTFHNTKDIHIHIPEGATPKDGPSAGITIVTALVSALTGIKTKSQLAMTGEVTLQGRVLAIGGLKEKLLAAKQHNMTTVLIPEENKEDLQEIMQEVNLDGMEVIMVNNMDQVLERAFATPPFKKKAIRKAKPAAKKAVKKKITRKK